ncbi:hypothetical protein LOD99_6931 [Oopsacas minuta]|uniref:Protein kinase domain-containing protein n=1 Tax=Oopsacas minuta TaxID=111878 RepID=A0AAV7JIT4_9METZ|nr:hypothetical protein LOD99_6931 [Oopsacas minuta]
MQNTLVCHNFQPQLWREHVCMNCFQIDNKHDDTQQLQQQQQQKRPNGILKKHNLKPLTPELHPRNIKSLRSDWLTPQPQTKITKFEYNIQPRLSKTLSRRESKNIPPINMDILLQSRTEPDGQLDEPLTNSPPSITALQKKQFIPPSPLKLQARNSVSPGLLSNSPTTPQVLPYAVSIVNDQEVQDFYNFNQLEQSYNEKQQTPKTKSSYQPNSDRTYPIKTQFTLFSPVQEKNIEPTSETADKKELSISTDSGTEMDAINLSPLIEPNTHLTVSPSNVPKSHKGLLSPKIRRRHRSDGPRRNSGSLESTGATSMRSLTGAVTSCIPIRLPRWSQKKRSKDKDLKSPRRKEFCKEDIHIIPPDSMMSQLVQKAKYPESSIPETSPTYCGVASLVIEPQEQQSPKKYPSGVLSPIKSNQFSPTDSQPSHHYLPLNLVPMSAINTREDLQTRFPEFSENSLDSNFRRKYKPFPLTPNASQEREDAMRCDKTFLTDYLSPVCKRSKPPSKPSRTFRTDNTHLLRYKSKSEMNLGLVEVPVQFDSFRVPQFRGHMSSSVTPYAVKPEIPAFPPNASQEEVKRSLVNVAQINTGYMQPNQMVATRQPPGNRYNRHVRSGSLYENVDSPSIQLPNVIQDTQKAFDTSSANNLLDSQTKLARPSSIHTSDSGSYVQMRIDQAVSDEIGQAVTMYKKIVSENSKLIRILSDHLYKQNMRQMNWEEIDWDRVDIVDNQRPPLNIAILIQQNEVQKEFSVWPKDWNPDDVISRAFQSIQAISSSIPRNPYVLHAHTLIDIPNEIRNRCKSLLQHEQACILDQTRAGSLEKHLVENKPLLELDPEKYEYDVIVYLIQILSGVAHMHRHKLVHRDLNLSDILLSRETDTDEILQVKISGFTYALHRPGPPRSQPFLYKFEELQWLGGDETKLPPEITNAQNNVPELNYSGTDCFAVGCLIYEMMSEANPFEDQNLITKSYTTEELPNFQQRSKYTVWIQKVAKGLLEMNLQRRLDATYALALLQLVVFDGERLLTDINITEKKVKAYISELQGKFLNKIIEKSSLTLLTGRALELSVLEKIELHFLSNSQPYTIVRALKHFQNSS